MKKSIFVVMLTMASFAYASDTIAVKARMNVDESEGVFVGADNIFVSLIKSEANDSSKPYSHIMLEYEILEKKFSYRGEIFSIPEERVNYNAEITLENGHLLSIFLGDNIDEESHLWTVMVSCESYFQGPSLGTMALLGTPEK